MLWCYNVIGKKIWECSIGKGKKDKTKTKTNKQTKKKHNHKQLSSKHWYLPPISLLRAISILLYPFVHCHCHFTLLRRAL